MHETVQAAMNDYFDNQPEDQHGSGDENEELPPLTEEDLISKLCEVTPPILSRICHRPLTTCVWNRSHTLAQETIVHPQHATNPQFMQFDDTLALYGRQVGDLWHVSRDELGALLRMHGGDVGAAINAYFDGLDDDGMGGETSSVQARRDIPPAQQISAAAAASNREKIEREREEARARGNAERQRELEMRERAERERAERERAELERAERERAELESAKRERAERQWVERERAERERTERERAELERAERERAELERAQRERAERERAELERAERMEVGKAELERGQQVRVELDSTDKLAAKVAVSAATSSDTVGCCGDLAEFTVPTVAQLGVIGSGRPGDGGLGLTGLAGYSGLAGLVGFAPGESPFTSDADSRQDSTVGCSVGSRKPSYNPLGGLGPLGCSPAHGAYGAQRRIAVNDQVKSAELAAASSSARAAYRPGDVHFGTAASQPGYAFRGTAQSGMAQAVGGGEEEEEEELLSLLLQQ